MTIAIRTLLNNPNNKVNVYTLVQRRLQGTARGLGYWAARDLAKSEMPGLLSTIK